MPVTNSDDLLQAAHLTEPELLLEIAVMLFHQDRLTLGQAAAFADLPQIEMQRLLASRQIPLHYDSEDLDQDLATAAERPPYDDSVLENII